MPKTQVVIDSCVPGVKGPHDKQFLRDLQELFCNDITANGCHLKIWRKYAIFIDGKHYPDVMAASLPHRCEIDTRDKVDVFNAQLEDFFTRNEIAGNEFLIYVSW